VAHEVVPTDSEREASLGRIALWLDAEDLRWLARHCCCPPDAGEQQRQRCARLRFRASAALHKAGLESEQQSGAEQSAAADRPRE
jgi:hypothetical protein